MSSTGNHLRLGLLASSWLLPAALYARLPDPYPTHWNLAGQVDGWTAKPIGPFVLPLALLAVHALLAVSRRARGDAGSPRVLEALHVGVMLFLAALNLLVLHAALGGTLDVTRVSFVGAGLLLAVVGNYLGKLRRNPWFGVRTPWTLASDEVWERTHRASGPIFVVGGLAIAASSALGSQQLALVLLLLLVAAPVLVSWHLSRRPTR
jgi:uncharacterized membrane protein